MPTRPTTLAVIVPAHNEQDQITDTLDSLLEQSRPADRIIVVSDNSTDATVAIAQRYAEQHEAVIVLETVDNPHRKSGALNQAWSRYAQDTDYVFTMDADTILAADFFEKATELLDADENIGGACACPMLKDTPEGASWWGEMLWRMGKIDFGGYMRMLCRWKFRPEVLFGYASIFRQEGLQQIAAEQGEPWAVDSIVEDYKITLDLRRLDWALAIIPGAMAYTDVPTTMRELWIQRMRWAGGTWQELARAGWQPYTRRVWLTCLGSLGATGLRALAITAWVLVFSLGMEIAWHPFWLIPVAIGVADRLDITRYTAKADWKDRLLVSAFLPLELMAVVREAWTVWSAGIVATRRHLAW